MERREFLKLGAAAGTIAACTPAPPAETPPAASEPPPDMERYLAQFDAHMEAITTGTPLGDYQIEKVATRAVRRRIGSAKLRERDALARKSLRAIYLAGTFHELPEEARAHPGMQARLRRHAAEVDHAVFGTKQLLRELSPREREHLRQALRRDPGLAMKLAETVDGNAASIDVPQRRRRMFRTVVRHASWRLRHQPPNLIIDECVEKVERVARRNGYDEELQRKIAAGVAAKTFWDAADGQFAGQSAHRAATVNEPGAQSPASSDDGWVVTGEPEPAPAPPTPRRGRGQGTVNTGLWMMGIALGVGLLGAAIVSGGSLAGAFLLTAGVILFIVGLIVLIVGAIMNASEPAEAEDDLDTEYDGDWRAPSSGHGPEPASSGAGPPTSAPPPPPGPTVPAPAPAGSAAPPSGSAPPSGAPR